MQAQMVGPRGIALHEAIRPVERLHPQDRDKSLLFTSLPAFKRVFVLLWMTTRLHVLQHAAEPAVVGDAEMGLAVPSGLVGQLVARTSAVERRVLVVRVEVTGVVNQRSVPPVEPRQEHCQIE